MKKVLFLPALALAASALLVLPASAAPSLVASFSTTAVNAAAHAKHPHYVTNVDLRADAPANGNQAVSVVYLFGGFANQRIAGFVVATQDLVAQCEQFPAAVGAAPHQVPCPAKGTPVSAWAPRITAAQMAGTVDTHAYALSSSPSVVTLAKSASTKGLLPTGYVVHVAKGINPNTGGSAIRFTVVKGSLSINVCVSAPTPPHRQLAFLSTYGLAPC